MAGDTPLGAGTNNTAHAPTRTVVPARLTCCPLPTQSAPWSTFLWVQCSPCSLAGLELGQVTPASPLMPQDNGTSSLRSRLPRSASGELPEERSLPPSPMLCGSPGQPGVPRHRTRGTMDIRVIPERRFVMSSHVPTACCYTTTPSLPLTLQYVRVHVCTCVCMHRHICVCVWDVCTHVQLHICKCIALIHVPMWVCVHMWYTCVHIARVHMACVQVCVCAYMCVCVLTHTSHYVRWSEADSYRLP